MGRVWRMRIPGGPSGRPISTERASYVLVQILV